MLTVKEVREASQGEEFQADFDNNPAIFAKAPAGMTKEQFAFIMAACEDEVDDWTKLLAECHGKTDPEIVDICHKATADA